MINQSTRRRIDASDPASWMRDLDPQVLVEHYGPAGAPPRHDRTPVRPLTRPGRALQGVPIPVWLRAIAACMTGVILVTLPTGFGLLPARAPLVPMIALMGVLSALGIAGARNGRDTIRPTRLMSAALRCVETFGWSVVIATPVLIALVVAGVLDVR